MTEMSRLFDTKDEIKRIEDIYKNSKEYLGKFKDSATNIYSDIVKKRSGGFLDADIFSEHLGYINLFPLFFGYIKEDSLEFQATLDLMNDPSKIWSNFGLMSLAKSDPYYMRNDQYWTGPIWININYMVLRGLKLHYGSHGRAMQTYQRLRQNLINTICGNWEREGFFFENYDENSGRGQRNRPFNGWTSLITAIISEKYI